MDLLVIDTYQQFYAIKRTHAGARLDYLLYKQDLQEEFQFNGPAHAYIAMVTANTQNFVNSLSESGYLTHAKVPKKTDKGAHISFDLDLTIRVLNTKPKRLFLGSSSYNLIPLLRELRERKCDIVVCAASIPKAFKKFAHTKDLSLDVLRNSPIPNRNVASTKQLELPSNSDSDVAAYDPLRDI